jgi:hypothetical protein
MATTADIQTRLTEAQTAYHRLITGTQAVEIRDSNGESIRYSSANLSRLRGYIRDLENELAGTAASSRRPLRPVWG